MKKVLFGVLAALVVSGTVWAADRPGTPLSTLKNEAAISQDQAVMAVEKYVNDMKKDKGSFVLKDDKSGEVNLTLDKIEKDHAAKIDDNKYFVPASFKGADGKSYMVDFILKPALMGGEIKVSDSSIRKVDGVDRYQWKQEGDTWKKDTSAAAGETRKMN